MNMTNHFIYKSCTYRLRTQARDVVQVQGARAKMAQNFREADGQRINHVFKNLPGTVVPFSLAHPVKPLGLGRLTEFQLCVPAPELPADPHHQGLGRRS